jgi:microcin C transport system permease protein
MRAQFYRERARDYVAAAISIGVPTHKILFKHILPNSLVPIVTSLPFAVVSGITSLLSLDFLGFGLMPPTPSWGQMVSVGLSNLTNGYWWLILVPLSAMFLTLIAVVFIGEAIREAFDPKVFSRLR